MRIGSIALSNGKSQLIDQKRNSYKVEIIQYYRFIIKIKVTIVQQITQSQSAKAESKNISAHRYRKLQERLPLFQITKPHRLLSFCANYSETNPLQPKFNQINRAGRSSVFPPISSQKLYQRQLPKYVIWVHCLDSITSSIVTNQLLSSIQMGPCAIPSKLQVNQQACHPKPENIPAEPPRKDEKQPSGLLEPSPEQTNPQEGNYYAEVRNMPNVAKQQKKTEDNESGVFPTKTHSQVKKVKKQFQVGRPQNLRSTYPLLQRNQ